MEPTILIAGAALLLLGRRKAPETGPNGYGARDPGPPAAWQSPPVGPGSMSAPPGSAASGQFSNPHPGTAPPLSPPSMGGWGPSTGTKPSTAPRTLRATPPLGAVPARPPNLLESAYMFKPQPGTVVLR
jgi:hypothetical protein